MRILTTAIANPTLTVLRTQIPAVSLTSTTTMGVSDTIDILQCRFLHGRGLTLNDKSGVRISTTKTGTNSDLWFVFPTILRAIDALR